MKPHRIFIAINLPEKIKNNLSNQQLKWVELPCNWTNEENLHITLAFLGYLNDEELVELCNIVKEVAMRHDPLMIKLDKIIYGPSEHLPKMVWVKGERNKELEDLQKDLEGCLPVEKEKETRQYVTHITLGRLKQWEFRKIEPEERPEINENINLAFEAESIDVMESDLQKKGPEYSIIESFKLGE
jgi:RNA 2',3'-cyclic 3'-phosphodiesterase